MQMVAVQKTFLRHTQVPTLCVEWIHKHTECLKPILASAKEFRVGDFCVFSHIIEIVRNCQLPQAERFFILSSLWWFSDRFINMFLSVLGGLPKIEDGLKVQTYEGVRSNSKDVT